MASPLDTGLVFSLIASKGATEQVSGYPMSGRGSAQAINQVNGESVFDNRGINTGAFFNVGGGIGALVSDETVVFDMVLVGAPSGSVPAIGGLWRSTTQNDAMLVLERPADDTLQVAFRIGGATSTKVFSVGASSLYGKRIIVAASVARGTVGRSVFLRIASAGTLLQNQEQAYSATGSADITPGGSEYISIGSEPVENPSRNPNCYEYAQYHFSRVLSADEVVALSNPASGTPAGVTGSLNATLGVLALGGTGSVTASGMLSATLGQMAAGGAGSTTASGALATTLGGLTMTATGAAPTSGNLASTLAPLTNSMTGGVPVAASLAQSLGALTLAATGMAASQQPDSANGQLVKTLGGLTLSAAGAALNNGRSAILLSDMLASATGAAPIMGQAGVTLDALSLSAYGGVPASGALQASLGELTLTATAGMFVFTRSQARTCVIASENRRYTIAAENRTYRIEP